LERDFDHFFGEDWALIQRVRGEISGQRISQKPGGGGEARKGEQYIFVGEK